MQKLHASETILLRAGRWEKMGEEERRMGEDGRRRGKDRLEAQIFDGTDMTIPACINQLNPDARGTEVELHRSRETNIKNTVEAEPNKTFNNLTNSRLQLLDPSLPAANLSFPFDQDLAKVPSHSEVGLQSGPKYTFTSVVCP
ncbi:hypothetical protein H6P81_016185 [Aristolochia fimbriata]|uniref:Uncharacterized protein n=1 Tax=Aristolochia fimbriata TaxID=158543 RepID=A0AAV7E7I8_ARIFI|nr:hypothetical protein H6P81_016185 [Aristolochia fimbriata]